MPDPIKLQFRPGIDRETTDYGNTGGWHDCNLVRWQRGTPRSMGGWQRFTSQPVLGTMRSLFPWSTLDGNRYYATGTNLKYYIIRGNSPIDITPIRRTVVLPNNPFQTQAPGSTTIIVTDVNNGVVLGDFVTFSGATGPISGIPAAEFNMEHQVTSIIDADHYTIAVTTPAVAGGVNGGGAAVNAEYQINVGLDASVYGDGWGTGPWGENGWGEGSGSPTLTSQLRLWSEDNYGEDLLFNPRNGPLYYKDMSAPIDTRGVDLAVLYPAGNVPIIARQVIVSDNDRHTLAFAANTIGTAIQDRLLLRWSTSENVGEWTPDTTNTAGSLRLEGGSEFIKAVETTTEIIAFTDITLHSIRFIGPPFIFGQTRIATNVQLIGPNAAVSTGAAVAWMANGLFQMYDGVVRDMPCSIRSYIFDELLNREQAAKITAGVNRRFKEIIWLMPVNGSLENNFYVIMHYEDWSNPQWYYGSFNTVGRTTWLDAWFETYALAGAPDGYIYTHDIGATDQSGDVPTMLQAYLKSSVFELANGEDFMLVSRIIPDIKFTGSTVASPQLAFTFETRDYPGSAFVDEGPAPVTRTVSIPVEQYTAKVDKRFRGRSLQVGIETTVAGTLWELGVPRIYASPDGQR